MYTAKKIADWFLLELDSEAGDTMSPLKLQKLLYYAQAWHYVFFKEPLFKEAIQAWRHGPVVPSQYKRFAEVPRNAAIPVENLNLKPVKVSAEVRTLLDDIVIVYGEHSASYLEALTHSEEPWQEARGGRPDYEACTTAIKPETMIAFYSKKLKDGEQKAPIA